MDKTCYKEKIEQSQLLLWDIKQCRWKTVNCKSKLTEKYSTALTNNKNLLKYLRFQNKLLCELTKSIRWKNTNDSHRTTFIVCKMLPTQWSHIPSFSNGATMSYSSFKQPLCERVPSFNRDDITFLSHIPRNVGNTATWKYISTKSGTNSQMMESILDDCFLIRYHFKK